MSATSEPMMSTGSNSSRSALGGWVPRGVLGWVLAVVALAVALLMAVLAVCMAFPIRWDGLGKFGALVLFFPMHLLVFTLMASVLAFIAKQCRAKLAAWLFVLVVTLTATMALTPTVAMWERAREWNVPLSLGNYLAHAWHMNSGPPQTDRSVVYGTAKDGVKLELDVWRTGQPNRGPLRPAIVIVHGGAWVHGARSMLPDWDQWLNELGYEVFDVAYRMPPPVRWQEEIGDVKSALGWVAAHAAEYHVDPARISVMGHSAGANLAMLAAYSMGDPQLLPSTDVPTVAIHSVINLYGPTDLTLLYRTCKSREYVEGAMKEYIGGTPDEFPDRYRVLSPLTHVSAYAPPTITVLGSNDRLVSTDQADALSQALGNAAVPYETYVLPGSDHGFDVNWGGWGTQVARAKISQFLRKHG